MTAGRHPWWQPTAADRLAARRAGYALAIGVNLVLLYAAHHLLDWDVPFVTPAWAGVLWLVDLSFGLSIVANAAFLAYDSRWFRSWLDVGTTAVALMVGTQLWTVFPFQFGPWTELARLGLLGVLVALAIAFVVVAITAIVETLRTVLHPAIERT